MTSVFERDAGTARSGVGRERLHIVLAAAVAAAVFLVSLLGPFGGEGVDATVRWMLAALLVVVASVLISGLARTTNDGSRR